MLETASFHIKIVTMLIALTWYNPSWLINKPSTLPDCQTSYCMPYFVEQDELQVDLIYSNTTERLVLLANSNGTVGLSGMELQCRELQCSPATSSMAAMTSSTE